MNVFLILYHCLAFLRIPRKRSAPKPDVMRKLFFYAFSFWMPLTLQSFQKVQAGIPFPDKSLSANSYSSEVLDKWMVMQIRLMSTTPATFNGPFVRVYAYSGMVAYQAIFPGIPANSSNLFSNALLNEMPSIPEIDHSKKYHWPSSVNSALAYINRRMFPFTNAANRAAIDSLENALNSAFSKLVDTGSIKLSESYGKAVAQKIFGWAETDGYRQGNDAYTPRSGQGLWTPTPPSFASAVTPYWGNLRTIVRGSMNNTQPLGPIPYSEDVASDFYREVKQVYDISRNITVEQKTIAFFWRDINPGITAPGHWLNI